MRINTKLLLSGIMLMTGLTSLGEIPAGFDTENKWWTEMEVEEVKNGENTINVIHWPAGFTCGSDVVGKINGGRSVVWSKTNPDVFSGFVITPMLRAEAGEEVIIEARSNSSFSTADGINVYISSTREGLSKEETRTKVLALAGEDIDEDHLLSPEIKEYSFNIPSEGEYYIGFSLYNSGQLAGIYGLELVDRPHEWSILPGTVPSTAVQNIETEGSLKILNYGTKEEKAGTYTIITYVDGVATEKLGTVDIANSHILGGDGLEIPFTFRAPRPGKVTISAVVKAEDGYSIESGEFEVEVEKETLKAEKKIGEKDNIEKNVPLCGTYDNSETIALYTPEVLGLNDGDKIKSIYLNGYVTGNVVGTESHLRLCYEWTDESTLEKPNTPDAAYDFTGMTVVFDKENYLWTEKGTETEMVPILEFVFENPIVYEEGKSLKLLFHNERLKYKSGTAFEACNANPKTAWYQKQDNNNAITSGRFTNNWLNTNVPIINIVLDVQPRTLSGRVAVGNEGAQNAVVTLVSADGENVQYEGETDDQGNYSIDVIQSDRLYNMEAHTADFGEFDDEDLDFSEASLVKNLDLRREVKIDDESAFTGGADNSIVHFSKKLSVGYNMIALPVFLDASEVSELFGQSAKVYDYNADIEKDGKITVNFNTHDGDLTAGRPYLIYTEDESKSMKWMSRATVDAMEAVKGNHLDVEVTTRPMELKEGMVVIDESLIKDHNAISLAAANPTLPAYSGYLAVPTGKEVEVNLDNENISTGVEVIELDKDAAEYIYDLNGVRVSKPGKGLYVINGRLVLVK